MGRHGRRFRGTATDDEEREDPVFEERLVTPDRVKIWFDEFQKLCIAVDGTEFTKLRARRVFPLSGKCDYVSFLNRGGKETVMLSGPDKLDAESKEALSHALERLYYAATITRVIDISEKMGVGQWKVMTDRGYASFEVVDRLQIRRLAKGRIVMTDADGNRFEIEDVNKLDAKSQKLIASEI